MNHIQFLRASSLLLLTVIGTGCSTPSGPQISLRAGTPTAGDATLVEAQSYLARADYGLAIEAFRKILRNAPDSAAAVQGLAISYDRLQRFDLSDRYFQQALALSPRDPGVYQAYAASLRSQGRAEEAAGLATDMQAMLAMASPAADAVAAAKAGEIGAAVVTADVPEAIAAGGPAASAVPATQSKTALPAQAATLALPPMPSTPAATAQAAPARRGAYLERVSLSQVRLVTQGAWSRNSLTIDIGGLMAAPVATARPARIVNAVGRPGVAARFRLYLAAKGWPKLEKGDADFRLASSRVVYPPTHRVEALRLIKALPFAVTAVPTRQADRILVLVGRNALAFDRIGNGAGGKVRGRAERAENGPGVASRKS
jgi:hypothetical protein